MSLPLAKPPKENENVFNQVNFKIRGIPLKQEILFSPITTIPLKV